MDTLPKVDGRIHALTQSLLKALSTLEQTGKIDVFDGVTALVADVKLAAAALADEARTLDALNQTARVVASELDLERAVQKVTDAATQLVGAAFGAFFYNVRGETGDAYKLYTLSGASRDGFAHFPMPRNTALFGPTFTGESLVRSADITHDPRYGRNAPYCGMPPGHLPVRSYLAVPVLSRAGEVLGTLFFGHPDPGVFDERAERLAVSVAAHAAIAIDNARLYEAAQREILERHRVAVALRASERRLKAVLDNATVAVFLMNPDRNCFYMNAAAERLTGYQLAQAQGKRLHELIHHSRPDGSPYPVEECPIDRSIPESDGQQGEEIFVHADGRFYPVAFTASPIRDEQGHISGTIVEVRDIRVEKEAAERLREADRRKDEFLAVLAHELRNPLAPLRSGLDILRLLTPKDATLARTADMMGRQIGHLVRLVDDLLDLSRVTHGRLELRCEPVLLREVAETATEASRALIDAQEHELVFQCRDDQLAIDGDAQRLAQVISNLLSNSAKYTPRGGRITLTIARDADQAVISVVDTGIGIPSDSITRIFEMFSQIRADGHQTEGGLGIGLALVRYLVELHGGTVTARSAGVGKGSEFTVRLPTLAHFRRVDEVPGVVESNDTGWGAPVQVTRRRVLVADDNADAAASLTLWLELAGHEVHTATNGQQVVTLAERFRPDVIFMDLGMPYLDGLAASRKIRSQPWGQAIRIVALTGWGREEDRIRTQAAGIDLHWVKPVDPHALRRILALEPAKRA